MATYHHHAIYAVATLSIHLAPTKYPKEEPTTIIPSFVALIVRWTVPAIHVPTLRIHYLIAAKSKLKLDWLFDAVRRSGSY
jgi:hypothetical protein